MNLPDDLKDFEAPTWWRLHGEKVWATAFFVLLAAFVGKPEFHAAQATEEIVSERAAQWAAEDMRRVSWKADDLAAIVAACMDGRSFVWQDPFTRSDFAAFCHVEELGRVQR